MDESATVEITGKIMVISMIVLISVVVFVVFLHLYAKWSWWRIEQPTMPPQRQQRRGLDRVILHSIPILTFDPQDLKFKDGLDCAVCLSELVEGEKARLLPKCNHGFHVECIDMWFQSHSTCPLCRNSPLVDQSAEGDHIQSPPPDGFASEYSVMESPNFPTNVLFWGNETQVSTGRTCLEEAASSQLPSSSSSSSSGCNRPDGALVIDIPVNLSPEEESKSPVPTRLRSLRRLLSREKRVAPTSSTTSIVV
ncbi:zf-RING_2 domain-containing protein [Cephalotus follicularis]|uniref:RING-type E3 ubiquitin transferase n=1 Tax=Cephalotus follicularis TaxID=3775 RepID=A0A1Q3D483_CEPFO|nr:zf-RING_2 domain-containing protein [Cephalotus follicularis]